MIHSNLSLTISPKYTKPTLLNINLNLIDYLKFREFYYSLIDLVYIVDLEKSKKFIYTSKYLQDSENYLTDLYDKNVKIKQSNEKLYDPYNYKIIPAKSLRSQDKRIQLGLGKKVKYKTTDDCFIVAKFSDLQIFKDKKLQSSNYALEIYGEKTGLSKYPELKSKIATNKTNNLRNHFSVIASTIFTTQSTVNTVLKLLLYNEEPSYSRRIGNINHLNLKNIFIIDPNYISGPLF